MRIWRKLRSFILDLLLGHKVSRDFIMLRSDGGICSQISFWALGKYYEDKGYKVKYDLSWFEECGTDMDGKFARNYDMAKAFPDVTALVADELETYRYKKSHRCRDMDISNKKPPVYMGEYYDRWPLVIEYRDAIRESFKPDNLVFDGYNEGVLKRIEQSEYACAVHVRRGDLGVFNKHYGEPLGPEYFLEALGLVQDRFPNTFFFFFSDETDWINDNIAPKLSQDTRFEIVNGNGSDKGYIDLYLMSKCHGFIASHGSLAKYARVFATDDALIVEPKSKQDFGEFLTENAVAI